MHAGLLTALCLAAVGALLLAEARGCQPAREAFKTLASVAFVGVALALDATSTVHGRLVLGALVLSLAGDVLLLSRRGSAFLAGLVAFLLAHAAYGTAFLVLGVSVAATGTAAAAALLVGAGVLRWLWPGLGPSWRAPVAAYLAVILSMCAVAVGHAAAGGNWPAALGAIAFAASDVAVAREKFIRSSWVNKAWGLPAYYVAQLLLAWSLIGAA